EKEEQALLNNMTTKHQEQQKKLADHQARINEIWNTASKEKRGITKEEAAEIDRIQQQMMTTAVQTMSKSESEQKTILSRLKEDSGNITAQQAAETVQNSLKA
ncbi:hypothetical protein, partial [Mycobacterium tuberculosis]|uniref:hypothetical protein n=1 Tax=Mycobacterium tuberculosis TaxID=1773 RepID=UPI001BA61204